MNIYVMYYLQWVFRWIALTLISKQNVKYPDKDLPNAKDLVKTGEDISS